MHHGLNLLNREEEREMLPLCIDQGIAVVPWSPLARGRLTRPWGETSARQETDKFGNISILNSWNPTGRLWKRSGQLKRWRDASMALRWTAAAMQEATKGFRRLKAHKQLPV